MQFFWVAVSRWQLLVFSKRGNHLKRCKKVARSFLLCLSSSSFAVLILLLQWQMCQAMSDINNNKNRCCLMPGKRKRNKEGRKNKEEMWQLFAHLLSWVSTWVTIEFRLYTVFPQKDPSLNNNQILIIPQNSCSTYIKI